MSAGKNPMALDTCSILYVYKGVDRGELAVTVSAQNITTTPVSARNTFFSIESPPFQIALYTCCPL
jgi:hypothetical protein